MCIRDRSQNHGKSRESHFGGTLGVRNRSEAVVEGAQAALERPNRIEEDAQGAQEPTLEHSGLILERVEGVQSAPRIGRGESRSTFAKIDFFRLGDHLFLDFAFPQASQERSGAPSGLSLGTLGRSWGAPGAPQGRPWASLASLLGRFWSFGVTSEPLKAPRTGQGPIRELFWLDLVWFSIVFQTISACTLSVAKVCVIRSALFPAQLPTGLVAVWASPTGYIVRMAQGTNSLKLLVQSEPLHKVTPPWARVHFRS